MEAPTDPRDVDFTEVEAILRTHEHPPLGACVEAVMDWIPDAEFLNGWNDGGMGAHP